MFVPLPVFERLEDYNQTLFELCEKDQQRPHYKRKVEISTLMLEDKKAMKPLPK